MNVGNFLLQLYVSAVILVILYLILTLTRFVLLWLVWLLYGGTRPYKILTNDSARSDWLQSSGSSNAPSRFRLLKREISAGDYEPSTSGSSNPLNWTQNYLISVMLGMSDFNNCYSLNITLNH